MRLQYLQPLKWVAGLLIVTVCSAQTPVAAPQLDLSVPQQLPAATALTIPAGTVVPLTLDRQIMRKSKIGDSVHATVAFPVTIGNQLAIPANTDVEGNITALSTKDKTTHQPSVAIHFTRLAYPNGYTVNLDAVNSAALILPAVPSADIYADASFGQPHAFGPNPAADPYPYPQQPPQAPMNPTGKLTPGEKVAVIAGGISAFVGLFVFLIYHAVKSAQSPILFDAGWQFQMTTQTAFSVDTTRVIGSATH